MKNTIRSLVLLSLIASSNGALAEHMSHDEDCRIVGRTSQLQSKTFTSFLNFWGNGSGDRAFGRYAGKKGVDPNEAPIGTEEIVLRVVTESKRTREWYAAYCWSGYRGAFTRLVVVESINDAVAKSFGLTRGQKLKLRCAYEESGPDHARCAGR